MARRNALLAENPDRRRRVTVFARRTHGRFGPGVGGSIRDQLHFNVAGGFASALDGPIKPSSSDTLDFWPAQLLTRFRVDRSVRRRNQVSTRRLSSAFIPFNGCRFLLPVFESSQLSIHPVSTFKFVLTVLGTVSIRSLAFASCILSVRQFASCAIGLSLDSVPLRISRRRSWSMSGIAPSLLGVNR